MYPNFSLYSILLYLLLFPWTCGRVHLPPFFFLCNYHGTTQDYGLSNGDVVISVQVEGNPRSYVPGTFYQISISASEHFDSFLMTGLYTTTTNSQPSPAARLESANTKGQSLMCSIVHSQVSSRPIKTMTFLWNSPPPGTGCINFLATATFGQQLLFKDTNVLQLCEQGAEHTSTTRPVLAEVNSASVLIRDDFEADDFNPDIWETSEGGHIGDQCGTVSYGKSAILCDRTATRNLVTVPLNLTSARVLQFTIGAGNCRPHSQPDQDIIISYGLKGCTDWVEIEKIKAPTTNKPEVHIISLPLASRQEVVCLKFFQPLKFESVNKTQFNVIGPLATDTTKHKPSTTQTTITTSSVTTDTTKVKPFSSTTQSTTTGSVITDITKVKPSTTQSNVIGPLATDTTKVKPSSSSTSRSSTTESSTLLQEETSTKPLIQFLTKTWEKLLISSLETTEPTTELITTEQIYDFTDFNVEFTEDLQTEEVETEWNITYVPSDEAQADQGIVEVPYRGCWAIDNIVVVNTANPPNKIVDNLDPIDPSNWIFFPGAHLEHQCQSHGNAFVFEDRNQTATYAVTRDLNLDLADVQSDAEVFDDFEQGSTRFKIENGYIGKDCGIVHSGSSLIFDGQKKRQMCTEKFDSSKVAAVRFYFQFGGNGCSSSSKSPAVQLYLEDEEEQTLSLKTLKADQYMTSQLVSFPIVNSSIKTNKKNEKIRLCLLQKSHSGKGKDVWAVDDVALLPLLPSKSKADVDKVLQARINLECGPGSNNSTSIGFEYSTDHGASWHNFYTSCTPSTCNGHYQTLSSKFTPKNVIGWDRVSLPLPIAAQAPFVRFRSVQYGPVSVPWAIDDVFIGSCDDWCNGHGNCVDGGCSCDYGFEGTRCEQVVIQPASSLHETFEDPTVLTSAVMLDIIGATIGYQCGVLSSGKALVFNQDGPRILRTADVNTTSTKAIHFTLRVGSQSVTSSCPPPDSPFENILLEVTCRGGITWILLEEFSAFHFHQPRSITVPLPQSARGAVCHFRWRQPQHSGYGKDVWAIDDIHLSQDPSTSLLSVEMMDMPDLDNRLITNLGKLVDSFCERMRSVTFSSKEKNGEPRLLRTKDMPVGPGFIAQFDIVMGCGVPYTQGIDNQIYFQYSVDHAITWHLVEDPCLPPDVCDEYRPGTVYHHSEFENWVTVTVLLSPDTWYYML